MDHPTDTVDPTETNRVRTLRALSARRHAAHSQPPRLLLAVLLVPLFWGDVPPGLLIAAAGLIVFDALVGVAGNASKLAELETGTAGPGWERREAVGWWSAGLIHATFPLIGLTARDGQTGYLLLVVSLGIAALTIVSAQGFTWLAIGGSGPTLAATVAMSMRGPHPVRTVLLTLIFGGILVGMNDDIRRTTTGLAVQTVRAERLTRELARERDDLVRAEDELRRANTLLHHEATHDPLTGLANRALLARALRDAIATCAPDRVAAVVYLDLDRFKQVNDERGHAVGDELLCQVAGRIQATVGPRDTVARVGGDEFVIVLPGLQADGGREAADRIGLALGRPYQLADGPAVIGATLGLALAGPDADAHCILRHADEVMYHNKREGRTGADTQPRPGSRASAA